MKDTRERSERAGPQYYFLYSPTSLATADGPRSRAGGGELTAATSALSQAARAARRPSAAAA
jgi:hypothetical protein